MTEKQHHPDLSWRPLVEVSSFYVFREDIHFKGDKEHVPPLNNLHVTLLDTSHIPQMIELAEGKTPAAALHRRFERGDKCLAVFKDEELISFTWVTFNWLSFGCYNLKLHADEAYLFDMYVAPEHRGWGVAGYTRYQLYKYLVGQRKTRLISVSLKGNKPAFRFKEKLGGRIVDRGVSIKVCNRWRFGTRANGKKIRA